MKASREARIIDGLNRGLSMGELAAQEGVTLRRMQILVRDILARRTPPPPAEYLILQVSRLNKAMTVAFGAMAGGNLKAVDRVVRIVGEMDRYHGFFPRPESAPAERMRVAPTPQEPLGLLAPSGAGSDANPPGSIPVRPKPERAWQ